jgi:hypothetical protein
MADRGRFETRGEGLFVRPRPAGTRGRSAVQGLDEGAAVGLAKKNEHGSGGKALSGSRRDACAGINGITTAIHTAILNRLGFIIAAKENVVTNRYIEMLDIKVSGREQITRNLRPYPGHARRPRRRRPASRRIVDLDGRLMIL